MPKPEAILHIGTMKTGTTSIQRVLGARRAELLARGVCYPVSPGPANHGLLPAAVAPAERLGRLTPTMWEGEAPAARLARFRAEFAAEMAALPPQVRRVVLSAEQCSGLLDTPALIAALRRFLEPHVGPIRIVVYLRRQDSHFVSNYTQQLRRGRLSPFRFPAEGEPHEAIYDYDSLLTDWADVFGAGRVTPRLYETSSLVGGDAVADFLDVAGLDLPVPAEARDRRANRGFSPLGVALMQMMASRFAQEGPPRWPVSPAWRRFVAAVEALPAGEAWRPPATEARAFLARFEAINEAVRRRWFPERAALFAEPPADPPGAEPGRLDAAALLGALLTLLKAELSRAAPER